MTPRYDVVILGGAFAGSAAATLLRREAPQLSVLVVEKSRQFDAKVGEATTEMSAMFLTRRLALWQHLELDHLPKEGLRYWSSNEQVHNHAEASETGGFLRSAVPSFQLRRDALDEHLLGVAVAEGAHLWRPARAVDAKVGAFDQRVTIERGAERVEVACRWLLDATGRATFLGKRLGLVEPNDAHPTAAMWCRWRNVRHIDDLAARGPIELTRRNVGSRRLGTNHYVGFGYWTWVIPLGHGETSIGVVFDRRLVDYAERRDPRAAFREHLGSIPALAELLVGAEMRDDDFRSYSRLAYVCRQYMGEGWALLGDAAAFLDPFYSPGLDHACFTVEGTTAIVMAEARGEPVGERIAEHNGAFRRSYKRFFASIFEGKYFYMGEHDLLSAAFLIDTAQYYIFVVSPAYMRSGRFQWMPVLGPGPAGFNYYLMRFYNRRFAKIALARRAAGEAGRRNHGRRIRAYYDLKFAPFRMAARGVRLWLWAEIDYLRLRLGALFRPARRPAATPPPVPGEVARPT